MLSDESSRTIEHELTVIAGLDPARAGYQFSGFLREGWTRGGSPGIFG